MAKKFLSDTSFEGKVRASQDAVDADELVRKSQLDAVSGGTQVVFIQQTEPVSVTPYIWYQTDSTGKIIDIRRGPL